jgi:uncharacterized repeat protein (TIGR03803 family)
MLGLACTVWAATVSSSPAQTFSVLATFNAADGNSPMGSLVQGLDGNLYGTSNQGGASPCSFCGTVFRITPDGTLTTLHSFAGADGAFPGGGLVQAPGGNFYGTTESGGSNGAGTVFEITPSGTLTTLYSFSGADGSHPVAALLLSRGGNLYGTTERGGTSTKCSGGCGTVFKIAPGGPLTALHSFTATDGSHPVAALVEAEDGYLYGGTVSGGAKNDGTIFKITPKGTLTTVHSFVKTDGAGLYAALVQASDGYLYGATANGGTNNYGTVFKITPGGTLTTLYNFDWTDGGGPDGLVQATDGNFYGTASGGGAIGYGTIFEITPSGTLTTLHSLAFTDGAYPYAALLQATDGNFYGTGLHGGNANCALQIGCGTVFSLSVGLEKDLGQTPAHASAGRFNIQVGGERRSHVIN